MGPSCRRESMYSFVVLALFALACSIPDRPKSGLAIEARAAVPVCFRKPRRDEDIVLAPSFSRFQRREIVYSPRRNNLRQGVCSIQLSVGISPTNEPGAHSTFGTSKRNPALPRNKVLLPVLLCLGVKIAAGHSNDRFQQGIPGFLHGAVFRKNSSAIHVDDVVHPRSQR